MKPLALAALLVASGCAPASRRPDPGVPAIADKPLVEMDVEQAAAAMRALPGCKQTPESVAKLDPKLKGRFGLVACYDEIDGWHEILLVPAEFSAERQLVYKGVPGYKLVGARLLDHYLVLEFDKQQQYLDLLKWGKNPLYGTEEFKLAGFVGEDRVDFFEDLAIFQDALRAYAGEAEGSELLRRLPELSAKIAGGKRFRIQGTKSGGAWSLSEASDGSVNLLWPPEK